MSATYNAGGLIVVAAVGVILAVARWRHR